MRFRGTDPFIGFDDLPTLLELANLPQDRQWPELLRCVGNKGWRLMNLYRITNKDGEDVKFQPNDVQIELFQNLHNRTVAPKSRQHGITTGMAIYELDECVWEHNTRCAVIAHSLDDAQMILETKVKYPFRRLKELFPELVHHISIVSDSKGMLTFSNGSTIYVDTTVRSGTIQMLHVSEMGKLAAEYPERAKEVVTGAFNAITTDGLVVVESTAEGRSGYFFDFVQAGKANQGKSRAEITGLDWKMQFFGWWRDKRNRFSAEDAAKVPISEDMTRYFERVEAETGTKLCERQRAWYVKKADEQGEDMKREHPSTVDECFEEAIEGAVYSQQMSMVRRDGRICDLPIDPTKPVHTAWDLGFHDETVIWMFQIVGAWIHVVDVIKDSGRGMHEYASMLRARQAERRFMFGKHLGPHDLAQHDYGTGVSKIAAARALGLEFEIVPKLAVVDGVNAVRKLLPKCKFDVKRCAADNHQAKGDARNSAVKALEQYRKKWNAKQGVFTAEFEHNWASHAADAFRYLAVGLARWESRGEIPGGVSAESFGAGLTMTNSGGQGWIDGRAAGGVYARV